MLITSRTILLFVILVIFLFVLDMSAIQLFFMKPYRRMLRGLNKSANFAIRILPAIGFYLLLGLGMMVFVYPLIRQNRDITSAILYGMIFGLVLYGFFSLTNRALIEKWDLSITIMDTLWGAVFIAISAIFLRYLDRVL